MLANSAFVRLNSTMYWIFFLPVTGENSVNKELLDESLTVLDIRWDRWFIVNFSLTAPFRVSWNRLVRLNRFRVFKAYTTWDRCTEE